ncbi:catalase family peroxidase [Pseudomonas fluorescens]|uniref:Catalase-related peroxidase n=1 Tax=Pseudomonas fluorescens TaxID=294 RepID=A0A944DMP1_PSEFL|nr:catalase family peroxidase [Pseudomonas fluorescens]MBT2296002.1 catalase family peroxidase [Pseudomonas fluorescens]MBT2308355.1 catalase family peroxidase [Pseudomonas fluorescens]MBT2313566.1 catalase family peroxidase [Pseudomonas fluorescens]MBT2320213.1 catalase family peroxidase [Pseudomonas fluorescens]MBT2329625.1 catalase family peroxidase [Pseudomonas fluorescens]
MVDPSSEPSRPPLGAASLALRLSGIAVIVAALAGAFAYVNGSLDPQRLTPDALVNVLEKNNGVHPGFRRNHSKGVCVAGYFQSSGEARAYSSAQVFMEARTPVVGRFALPSGNPYAPDNSVPIRSLALRFTQANGQQWRTGMNSMPVFPVGTPEAFYQLQQAQSPDPATGKPNPAAVPAFFAAHPEAGPFLQWIKTARPSASYATETYNGINAFYLVNPAGQRQAVRWGVVPMTSDGTQVTPPQGADFLEQDLVKRLAAGPLRWQLNITLANPGDPVNDASKAWPADRKVLNAGTLVLERTQAQDDGECRDINYDPLILPSGIEGSEDPLLAARSAAYASSYLRRTSEVSQLPVNQESRP